MPELSHPIPPFFNTDPSYLRTDCPKLSPGPSISDEDFAMKSV